MKKDGSVNKIKKLLIEMGYNIVSLEGMHTSFDLIAQNKGSKFIIKVIYNIDSIDKNTVKDLRNLGSFFGAKPIIIGMQSNNGPLESNMIYERFYAQCMSPTSLQNIITGVRPDLASKSIGRKIEIDGTRLRYLRKLNNITMGQLATKLHVSKDTIYKHEKFDGFASKETVEKAEEIFESHIRPRSNYTFSVEENIQYEVFGKMEMQSINLSSAPFNIAAKKKNYYEISSTKFNRRTLVKRAMILKELSEALENNYPFFVGRKDTSIKGIAVISNSKVKKIEFEDELLDLLQEHSNL